MSTIATQISLVRYSGPIFDQQQQGSCVANAICGVIALQANEYHKPIAPLSRQQLYNDTRIDMRTFPADSGSVVSYAYNVAKTDGIANESSFTYGGGNTTAVPSAAVYTQAATQKILSTTGLNISQNYSHLVMTVGEQLMHGKGVLLTMVNIKLADGSVIHGGHEVFVVGINDVTQMVTFQNSWGQSWNGNGYGQIKYTDFVNTGTQGIQGMDVINGFKGVDVTWNADRTQIAMLYTGLLDRCGENAGVIGWENSLHNGASITVISDAFYGSVEGQKLYGALNNSQYINTLFHNILGRDVDPSGLACYSGMLETGTTRGLLAFHIMNYIDHYSGPDVGTMLSHDFLENRITVSMNYAITMQVDGTHGAAAVHALDGVTSDANTVPIALLGVRAELGWT